MEKEQLQNKEAQEQKDVQEQKVVEEKVEEDQEEELSLHEFLTLCINFEEDPSEENGQQINDFLDCIEVREYMPLAEKSIRAVTVISAINLDYDAPGVTTTLAIHKIVDGLLSYAINLKNDVDVLSKSYTAIDMFYEYGLVDTILLSCEEDYMRFCAYCDNLINVNNIQYLVKTSALLNTAEYDKWTKSLINLQKSLKPEFLKALVGFSNISNEDMQELSQVLNEHALNAVKQNYESGKVAAEKLAKDLKTGAEEQQSTDSDKEPQSQELNKQSQENDA